VAAGAGPVGGAPGATVGPAAVAPARAGAAVETAWTLDGVWLAAARAVASIAATAGRRVTGSTPATARAVAPA
jgi:hypothetical protein